MHRFEDGSLVDHKTLQSNIVKFDSKFLTVYKKKNYPLLESMSTSKNSTQTLIHST